MSHIMVPCQHSVRQSPFIQQTICFIRVFPLRYQHFIVNNVSVVEQILDVHPLPVCQDPVVDIKLILIFAVHIFRWISFVIFVVILGIAFQGESKVVIFPGRILFIGQRSISRSRSVLFGGIAFSVLYHNFHNVSGQVVFQRHICCKSHVFPVCRLFGVHLIPAS